MMKPTKVTIKDVARLAGVSPSSVSRYLNNESSVKPVAAYKIRDAIHALQYVPDVFARNLRSGDSHMVGIVLPHMRYFWGTICNILTNILFDYGYVCYVCVTDNDGAKERKFIHELVTMRAAGIVLVPSGQNTQYLRTVCETYHHLLLFDSMEFECDAVMPLHYFESAEKLTARMLQTYPEEPIFCCFGFQKNEAIRTMEKGVDSAAASKGIPSARVRKYFNCRVSMNLERAAEDVLAAVHKGFRPIVLCFGANFTEALLLTLMVRDPQILSQIHLGGFTVKELFRRLGYDYPCIFREDQECGVLLARVLLEKMQGKQLERAFPRIYYAPSSEHLMQD